MSEKHLTELPWKTLALKQGVKDLGLGKALAAYGCLDLIKEPAKALESLQQISGLAVKLKKANTNNADLVAYLDEMVKELKKTTPGMEARAKAAAADATRTASAKTPAYPKARLEEEGDEHVGPPDHSAGRRCAPMQGHRGHEDRGVTSRPSERV